MYYHKKSKISTRCDIQGTFFMSTLVVKNGGMGAFGEEIGVYFGQLEYFNLALALGGVKTFAFYLKINRG